jgi:hypothetical protein
MEVFKALPYFGFGLATIMLWLAPAWLLLGYGLMATTISHWLDGYY